MNDDEATRAKIAELRARVDAVREKSAAAAALREQAERERRPARREGAAGVNITVHAAPAVPDLGDEGTFRALCTAEHGAFTVEVQRYDPHDHPTNWTCYAVGTGIGGDQIEISANDRAEFIARLRSAAACLTACASHMTGGA